MALLSDADLQDIVDMLRATSQFAGGKGTSVDDKKDSFGKCMKKDILKNLGNFDGDRTKFQDWSMEAKMCIGACDEKVLKILEATEKQDMEVLYDKLVKDYDELDGFQPKRRAR